jgi:anti-sigma factor RsiW
MTGSTCPTPVLLSQLADGELGADESAAMRTHVDACDACASVLARFRAATAAVRPPLPDTAGPAGAGCLSSTQIAGWTQQVLSGDELRAATEHLDACDACLDEGLAAARMIARLDTGPMLAVPATLKARVASRWAEPAAQSLTAVVVGIARAGVRLLERHVIAPITAIDELPALAAVRGDETAEAVRFRICSPGAEIHAAVVPAGDVVGLTLTLVNEAGEVLAGQRVFVRRQGRSVFSARTDDAGTLRVQRIEAGVYEVSCPGIGTSFRLDLRR